MKKHKLTLGPLFFNWNADTRRDFYYRIADESLFDTVYLGEVVCSKREPFYASVMPSIYDRLLASGKNVVVSTLALVSSEADLAHIKNCIEQNTLIEANDVACLQALGGKTKHVIGPFINVFNESTLSFLVKNGAYRIVFPAEIPFSSIKKLASNKNTEFEVQVFGKSPLAIAARCYHARASGIKKHECKIICASDEEGLKVSSLDNQELFSVNGTQVLSHGYTVLLNELPLLQKAGVTHFRLSPQTVDMPAVCRIYRDVLDSKTVPSEAIIKLKKITKDTPYINGFFHGVAGMEWVHIPHS
ncbi:MAG: U32 family peptidase [Alphaproteobacteria bacterium]|nr:U32 family peptidase [Alphaproteobacteria bacterium]MCL2505979.1 U32 family peptidase [Alphaproteobacteria bacterium]